MLKIQVLQFLDLAIVAGGAPAWQSHLGPLMGPLLAAARERYYKVVAEALRVCTHIVPTLRPSLPAAVSAPCQVRVSLFPTESAVGERQKCLTNETVILV